MLLAYILLVPWARLPQMQLVPDFDVKLKQVE